MKSSVTDNILLPVAQIVKSYDTVGEVVIRLTSDLLEDYNFKEPVFIYFDGLPVPFFIENFKSKGASGAFIKFETVNDLSHAEELLKKEIFVYSHLVNDTVEEENMAAYLIGCTVQDATKKTIGTISDYLDYPGNPCLEIIRDQAHSAEPLLIPFHEELILKFDPKKRILQMEIPQGLLEL
ncbi:MAG: ribosome maturation factor RimM [Bacteroidales bacterium]